MEIFVDKSVPSKVKGFSIGWTRLQDISVMTPPNEDFLKAERRTVSEIKKRYAADSLKDDPTIGYYRDMLLRLDLDPSRMRISSEALARRAIKEGSLPHINSAVDTVNLASLKTFVTMSLFDEGKISGPILLRLATEGEIFYDIGESHYKLSGKELVLTDKEKVLRIYPCRDAEGAKITLDTEGAILIVGGAIGIDDAKMKSAMATATAYLKRFSKGRVVETGMTRVA